MEKQFIPYNLALKLKELGFDEECFNVYDTLGNLQNQEEMEILSLEFILAPLWQQCWDWFLKEHGLFVETTLWGDGIGYMSQIKKIKQEEFLEVYNLGVSHPNRGLSNWDFEKEKLINLNKLIEIVEQENK